MRLTERDVRLVKDIALSHVLSRDQMMELGYFTSVTRTNTRLRELTILKLVQRHTTPFFGQSLYMIGPAGHEIVGQRIAALVQRRLGSPRFVQHALSITNVRTALTNRDGSVWRFEQQVCTTFKDQGKQITIRPDGVVQSPKGLLVVEVDLCHVSHRKFTEKLEAYDAFIKSGQCQAIWKVPGFQLLTVTTGAARAASLYDLTPQDCSFASSCVTFEELKIPAVGAWS